MATDQIVCRCGWEGTVAQASLETNNAFLDQDAFCPSCDCKLGVNPTNGQFQPGRGTTLRTSPADDSVMTEYTA